MVGLIGVSKRWTRRHQNGWFATVSTMGNGLYGANAHSGSEPLAAWAALNIADLDFARQIADGRVPLHDCDCPAWREDREDF
jgi:hypothetical protein